MSHAAPGTLRQNPQADPGALIHAELWELQTSQRVTDSRISKLVCVCVCVRVCVCVCVGRAPGPYQPGALSTRGTINPGPYQPVCVCVCVCAVAILAQVRLC